MDENLFTPASPGQLVNLGGNIGYGFVPSPLPANFKFNPELWPLLAEAKQQVALLEGIGRTLPNPGLLLKPLADREALQSSRLEGTYVTAKEFLLFDLEPDESKGEPMEVYNYRRALNFGLGSELPLCLRLIKELHSILMQGVKRTDFTPGDFRKHQVGIGANGRFIPPPQNVLADCLNEFEKYMNAKVDYDPLVHCFLCHYQFETIHPFHDGNGRVGRLLLALMLQRLCGLTRPWLYLSDILERQREQYCASLFDVSAKGDWDQWLRLCLLATVDQAKDTVKRCDMLQKLRADISQRASSCGGNIRLNQIVEQLFESPFVRVINVKNKLDISYPTAKADCERLVECGVLRLLPALTPATFYSPEIFNVAYDQIGDETQ